MKTLSKVFIVLPLLLCGARTAYAQDRYELVKDIGAIKNGDNIIIVGKYTNKDGNVDIRVMDKYNENNYLTEIITPKSDGTITPKTTTTILTIEKLDEHWYLKDGDFYLYTVEKSNACLKRNTEKTKDSKLNITMNSDYSVVAEFCEIGKKYSRTIGLNRNYVNCYSHKNYPIWFYKKILSTTTLDENDAFIEEKIKGSDDRVDVLVKRKFYNDSWNTWCMPFDMTLGELNALFGEGTKVYEFSSADEDVET